MYLFPTFSFQYYTENKKMQKSTLNSLVLRSTLKLDGTYEKRQRKYFRNVRPSAR